ncbi:hypothetical protein, conserved [Trypanosoma brucei brucei TREU927]|uniref:Uncharacterized protein n=3 Tax=Trypanozoon TaxID=39700 RepID=Q382X4_TRYB2|nr:hypothetical protein, conserved [Trypanosoma brucei brucei TREU927]EAN80157.1 hypothetical protein, conserved [Trypanosoma brucei brucei TREU927]
MFCNLNVCLAFLSSQYGKENMNARKPLAVSAGTNSRSGEGDWKSTMRSFREGVRCLGEENEALRTVRSDLDAISRKLTEKMNSLVEENGSFHKSMSTLLDDERRKVSIITDQNENLLHKLEELRKEYDDANKEISRLTDLVHTEKSRNNSVVGLFEKKLAEKEDEYQTELRLREQSLEKLKTQLEEKCSAYEAQLTDRDNLLQTERCQWKLQKEVYEKEIERLLSQVGKFAITQRSSSQQSTLGVDVAHAKPPLAPVPPPAPTDEEGDRAVVKKRRLEAVRQQRRLKENDKNDTTLASIGKLKDLKESLQL